MPPQLIAPMDCRSFRKHHLAYLDDTLAGDQMASAQRHIMACDPCAAHDTLVRRSLMVARNLSTIEPSAAFQERLQAKLAQCRQERVDPQAWPQRFGVTASHDAAFLNGAMSRPLWRSPRTLAALAASAVIGTLVWRGLAPSQTPLVAMQPVIATQPATPATPPISPLLLQAMATGNAVWPATVLIEDMPSQITTANYTMSLDGR
jgi:hypothetical protein